MAFEIKIWIEKDTRQDNILDAIRTDAYYELRRAGIAIPLPQRVVHYERPRDEGENQTKRITDILGRNMIFGVLDEAQRGNLVTGCQHPALRPGRALIPPGRGGWFALRRGRG